MEKSNNWSNALRLFMIEWKLVSFYNLFGLSKNNKASNHQKILRREKKHKTVVNKKQIQENAWCLSLLFL